jgi:hypothetical protein
MSNAFLLSWPCMQAIVLSLFLIWWQGSIPMKPNREFEVTTRYELKKKPTADNPKIVFDKPQERARESASDMLPYLIIELKVKKWHPDVEQVRVVDDQNKTHMKKKVTDEGFYTWDMGYVDDIKDKVTSGKFVVQFQGEKQTKEIITIQVEEDGTFLVNGERRGKF